MPQQGQRFTNRYPLCCLALVQRRSDSLAHRWPPVVFSQAFTAPAEEGIHFPSPSRAPGELNVLLRISESIAEGTNDANKFRFITMDLCVYISIQQRP